MIGWGSFRSIGLDFHQFAEKYRGERAGGEGEGGGDVGAVLVDAGGEFDVGGPDAQGSAGAFDLEAAGGAEVGGSDAAGGEDFLLDLKGLAFGKGHAIADQWAGGTDLESVATGLFNGGVNHAENRAVIVLFGKIAGEQFVQGSDSAGDGLVEQI